MQHVSSKTRYLNDEISLAEHASRILVLEPAGTIQEAYANTVLRKLLFGIAQHEVYITKAWSLVINGYVTLDMFNSPLQTFKKLEVCYQRKHIKQ